MVIAVITIHIICTITYHLTLSPFSHSFGYRSASQTVLKLLSSLLSPRC